MANRVEARSQKGTHADLGPLRPEYIYGSGLIQQSDASGLERDLTGLNRRHFLEGRFGPVSMQIEPARRIASRSHHRRHPWRASVKSGRIHKYGQIAMLNKEGIAELAARLTEVRSGVARFFDKAQERQDDGPTYGDIWKDLLT